MESSINTGPLQAYRTEVVVEGFSRRVETMCLWGEQLLAGLQEGSLLFFQRLPAGDSSPASQQGEDAARPHAVWQVTDAHRDVERKALLQMFAISLPSAVSPVPSATALRGLHDSTGGGGSTSTGSSADLHRNGGDASVRANSQHLLLALTTDGLNVHSLPNARLRCQGLGTKGASCFAWHAETRTVAVAVKRRLLLFRLVASEGRKGGGAGKGVVDLEEVADLALPDAMTTIAFAGPNLFLGSRKQYFLMANVLSALPHTPLGGSASSEAASSPIAAAAAAAASKAAATAMVAVNVGSVGSALAPAIAVCPSGEEVLLACDNAAAFLSPSGTPSRRSSLKFKEPLLELVATDYYVVGFLASGAEVHSLRRTGDAYVSQFMPEIQGARIVSSPGMSPVDGSIFVGMSGDQGIRRLVPLPLETQAELLAAAGEYQEALALAALASARASQAAQRHGQLQQQQGQQPQQQEEFQGRALLASPQGNWHPMAAGEDADSMSAEGGGGSDSVLEDRLRLLYGNHLFASGAWDEGAAQLTLCSGRVTGLTGAPLLLLRLLPSLVPEAWRSALPDHAAGTPLLTVTEPDGPSFATASATLLPYLMSYRTRIISALQSCHDSSRDACSNGVGDGKLQNGSPAVAEACIRVLSIIDVAVVAILLAQPEDTGALLRFVQQPKHWIDLEEGEKLLSSHGYYAELAALYKHYSKHEQGLELLRRTSQQPDSLQPHARGAAADLPGLPGVWATVRYMVTLGGMDRREVVPLIRRHAKWVLEADPDAGLQAFLEMQPPLDPSTVLSILHQHSPHFCSMYLEAALQLGVALPQDYHSELLLIYLQEILSKDEDALQTLKGPKGSDEEEEQGRDRGMASLGKGKEHPRESSPKATKSWAHSKSAIARTHTELLFPLDPEQKRATPAISIVPRRTLSRVAQEDAESRPRSLGTLERTKGSQASLSQTLLSDEVQESRSPSLLLPGFATDGDYGAEGSDRQRHARTPSDPIPNFEVELAPDSHHSRFLAQHQAQQQELQQQTPTQHPSGEDELQQQGDVFGDQQHPGLPAQSFRQQQGEQMAPACTKRSRRRRGVRRLGSGYGLGSLSFTENGAPPSLYERLRHLVYTSPYIDPDYVLTKLPPGQLPEIRALMLERLRRHREALSLYVHDLRSLSAAEAYCDRVYAAEQALLPPHLQARHQLNPSLTASPTTAPKELPAGPALGPTAPHTLLLRKPSDIYLMLVQVVLAGHQFSSQQMPSPLSPMPSQSLHEEQRQQHGEQQQHQQQQGKREHSLAAGSGAAGGLLALDERTWSQLTWLLSRKCGRMDPLEVLEILPEDVPLCDLMPWLGAALGHCTEQTRNMAVVKHLRRSESLNLREAVGRAKQGHVLLSSERICCLCYKRIGPAVFVAHPDRTLAHYVCHTRKEKSKK